ISRWQQATGDRIEYVPFQDPSVTRRFPELTREQCEQAVQFIDIDGHIYSAAEAVFRALAVAPSKRWPLRGYQQISGVAPITEGLYRFIANYRTGFSFLTRLLWRQHVEQPTHFLTRWLFLRLLGIVYFIAFVSLWLQIDGLLGSKGIAPATQFMENVHTCSHAHNVWDAASIAPTLCWFNASDSSLHFLCGGGVVLSALVILGIATAPSLALLWLFYLSLSVVGEPFMGFQWDALLLETGFLAIFFAPRQLLPGLTRESPPSRTGLWLLRLLLFRLMFASGVVKLATGDKTWHSLTALPFHYETQPLPTWIGWHAHQLPLWFQKFSCGFLFAIELGIPFLIFAPRRLRLIGCGAIVTLMALIALTGNYCFFNLLAVTLCVLLLDDAALRRFFPTRWRNLPINPHHWRCPCWITAPVAAMVLLVTTMTLAGSFREPIAWPSTMVNLFRALAPLRSFNGYGLFAMMTTARPEIIIEGSNDGQAWSAYEFKYKPGDPTPRPAFVAPHQPR